MLLLHITALTAPTLRKFTMYMPRFTTTRRSRNIPMTMRIIMELMRIPRIDANIVIRKFTHLRVVDAKDLGFFCGSKTQARDVMHDPEDDGGENKGVPETSGGVGELVGELDVVVVEPASGDVGDAIEACDTCLGEETGQKLV